MDIQTLFLAKIHSEQYPLLYRIYEMQHAMFAQGLGFSDETAQQVLVDAMESVQNSSDMMLRILLENLQLEFPACFEPGESIDELIKKISPSFPGKPWSSFKGGEN